MHRRHCVVANEVRQLGSNSTEHARSGADRTAAMQDTVVGVRLLNHYERVE